MKRFLAGVIVGLLVPGLGLLAQQHRASEKIVEPQVLVDNAKVKMVRWLLEPGEGSPVHTHALDHVSVVIRGSTLHDVETNGTTKENPQPTGAATFK
jgi:quercetin dioxygenase-like cupin family protein